MVALNAMTPMCAMPMMGMGMGGCGAGAYDEANWQAPMREQAPGVPILQDEQGVDAWSAFGGGHDDLFVYDRSGRLFAHLCSAHLCSPQPVRTDLDDPLGFESVRTTVVLASRARACDDERREGGGGGRLAETQAAAVVAAVAVAATLALLATARALRERGARRRPPPPVDDDIELMRHES